MERKVVKILITVFSPMSSLHWLSISVIFYDFLVNSFISKEDSILSGFGNSSWYRIIAHNFRLLDWLKKKSRKLPGFNYYIICKLLTNNIHLIRIPAIPVGISQIIKGFHMTIVSGCIPFNIDIWKFYAVEVMYGIVCI